LLQATQLHTVQLLYTKFLKSTAAKLLLGSGACATSLSASATSLLCNKTCSYTLSVGRAVAKGAALYCTNIEKKATAPFRQLAEKCCWQSYDQLLLYKHALKSPHGKQVSLSFNFTKRLGQTA